MRESLVEELDQADYLTQKLRALEPKAYDVELKRSKATGFAWGVFWTLVVLSGAVAGLHYLAPETLDLLLAVLS